MDEGLKILLNAYWGREGWKSGAVAEADFALAKEQGYMFDDPKPTPHAVILWRLRMALAQITPADVANAFLYSLSTRALAYRSALGSYWFAVSISAHESTGQNECTICGWKNWLSGRELFERRRIVDALHVDWTLLSRAGRNDLNVLNFERYKWGGVRHTFVTYALFDLEQFLKLPKPQHTDEDERILRDMLACVSELEPRNKAAYLQRLITKKRLLPSNRDEVNVLLNILGVCGVLSSKAHPCYAEKSETGDASPSVQTSDYLYPLCQWRAGDGVNRMRYRIVFGKEYDG